MNYIQFKELCDKNLENAIDYILNDATAFKDFFKYDELFYYLTEIDYELLKKIIYKIQENNLNHSNTFIASVSKKNQYKILNEPYITDDTLIYLIKNFSNEVKSYFFTHDTRALYLYNKFNIPLLAKDGVKFSDNILKKKDFFESLKSKSFIEFRFNINNIEKYNNPIIIEERLNEYYTELTQKYDSETEIFDGYKMILNNPKLLFEYNEFTYLLDKNITKEFYSHLTQDKEKYYFINVEQLIIFLKNETSKKLSEIIIDAIFKDNIYNVWINIKEMIRYNNYLAIEEKILNDEKLNFYNLILNFDKLNNRDKINLYNNLKNKNYNLIFYEDVKKAKNFAYKKIKEKLINPNSHPEYIDKENTANYGVNIYDLRDKEYFMLVRTQSPFKEQTHYRRGCYTIISNEETTVFASSDLNSILYGYISFKNDTVSHMFEKDSYSTGLKEKDIRYVNRIMSAEEIVNSFESYNEIQIVNLKSNKGKHWYNAQKPDFIVVFDVVRENHIKESKRLNIPIVIISKKTLNKEKLINIPIETYIYGNLYDENIKRAKR